MVLVICLITGLKLNCAKSKIYFGSVSRLERERICGLLQMEEGSLPMKYLGIPLTYGHLTCEDYNGLTDRICSKINSWQARQLSFDGRAQLVRSSIFGLHNFWCANVPIPKYVIQKVEQRIRTFLWAGKGEGPYHSKVSWKTLCLPLREGGLGFKCMLTWSRVCLGKLLWDIASMKQTLWVQWVHSVRLRGVSVWAYKRRGRDPWYWRKILKVRAMVRQKVQVLVGNGSRVFFWYDSWCPLGPVWDYLDEAERDSLQIPLGAKLSEVEWVMPGARRQTVRLVQVRDCFVQLAFSEEDDQWLWGAGEFVQSQLLADVRCRGATSRLSTNDRLCSWGMEVDPHCVLCGGLESHDHLFFVYPYSAEVWRVLLQRLGEYRGAMPWVQERLWVEATMGGRSFPKRIKQVAFVSTLAVLWEERNLRCFQGVSQ
ncbi:reverse transcriptase [Lithospermum erythrorhizon]|uniref:Reverse transcriptase n=1 Tax=Lithospermum erythrorhizon TaxID=34254 RepID=A0AAV3QUK1_LITER